MSLKLFRSTGYSSILSVGETRQVATHPGWLILFTSLWVGFACNVALWRELGSSPGGSLGQALTTGAFAAASAGVALSVLGWRKTLKPAALLIVFVAALAAIAAWQAPVPADTATADTRLSSLLSLSWRALLHWQVGAILAGLALPPAIGICNTRIRRLPGNRQLGVNLTGILAAGAVLAPSGFLLFRGVL
jgi:glucan phosphoethanolaminetransferase (alkaline phosphatase superfamily)